MSFQVKTNLGGAEFTTALSSYSPATFSFWVRFISFLGTGPMLDMTDATDSQFSVYQELTTPPSLQIATREFGNTKIFTRPYAALTTARWYLIQGTINDTVDPFMRLWVDGTETQMATSPLALTGALVIVLGAYGGGSWTNAYYSRVRVWTAKLSDAELIAEGISSQPVRKTNLYADWPLVVNGNDASGNGRNLTLHGSLGTDNAFDTTVEPPLGTSPIAWATA